MWLQYQINTYIIFMSGNIALDSCTVNYVCLFQVVVVTDYAEGELFQILEDDGSLPEEQVIWFF